jgi:hypothetical protein
VQKEAHCLGRAGDRRARNGRLGGVGVEPSQLSIRLGDENDLSLPGPRDRKGAPSPSKKRSATSEGLSMAADGMMIERRLKIFMTAGIVGGGHASRPPNPHRNLAESLHVQA